MENVKRLSAERMRPIRDEVYHRIRQAILRGTYKPGEKLQEVGHKLAEIVYSDTAAQASGDQATGGADDVVDADYEVVDDKDER